jgi:hypothetical protein
MPQHQGLDKRREESDRRKTQKPNGNIRIFDAAIKSDPVQRRNTPDANYPPDIPAVDP